MVLNAKNSAYNKAIVLTDTYDFDPNNDKKYNGIVSTGVEACLKAHADGNLKYYYVHIEVDMTNVLYPTILSANEKQVKLRIKNRKNSRKKIIYNQKTVTESNALARQNLYDLNYTEIAALGYVDLSIDRAISNCCVLSYVCWPNEHYSTLISIYWNDSCYLDYYFVDCIQAYLVYDFLNLGKSGNSWILLLQNRKSYDFKIEYNEKNVYGVRCKKLDQLSRHKNCIHKSG